MTGREENFCAKFCVLSENVRHHIKEEEGELFPQAKKTSIDFDALGARMRERKEELMRDGVPPGAEDRMVATAGLGESPARRAVKTLTVPLRAARRGRKH